MLLHQILLRPHDYEHRWSSGCSQAERERAGQHEGVHQWHHQPAAGHWPNQTVLLAVPGPGHADLLGPGVRQPRVVGGGAALVLPLPLWLPAFPWAATSNHSDERWVIVVFFTVWRRKYSKQKASPWALRWYQDCNLLCNHERQDLESKPELCCCEVIVVLGWIPDGH